MLKILRVEFTKLPQVHVNPRVWQR